MPAPRNQPPPEEKPPEGFSPSEVPSVLTSVVPVNNGDGTEERRFLTKEAILGLDDRKYEEVYVEAWDAWIMLRGLSGSERDDWEASMIDQKEQRRQGQPATMVFAHMRAKLLVKCIVDPKTKTRLFRDTDVIALGEKSAAALQPLFEKAQVLSALRDEDVEELTKNSSSEANDENGSASPPTSESP